MRLPAPPRTIQEVQFFVDESPCERCGRRGLIDELPGYLEGSYGGMCASCSTRRSFEFEPLPARLSAPPFFLSDEAQPSALFSADELRAIADRELEHVPHEPADLATVEALDAARIHLVRAGIALHELAKFHPGDPALAAEVDAAFNAVDGEFVEA